jgi:hypothetical protein
MNYFSSNIWAIGNVRLGVDHCHTEHAGPLYWEENVLSNRIANPAVLGREHLENCIDQGKSPIYPILVNLPEYNPLVYTT